MTMDENVRINRAALASVDPKMLGMIADALERAGWPEAMIVRDAAKVIAGFQYLAVAQEQTGAEG